MSGKATWLPIFLAGVSTLAVLMIHPRNASALTLEQVPEGYLVRLENGESVNDAWRAIWNERRQTNAPVGTRDVIELGEGVFPLMDSHGNSLLHYRSSSSDPVAPQLVIRGLGAAQTAVRCADQTGSSACIVSLFGLTLEDLSLLVAQRPRAPVLRVDLVDLTLRRVEMVGQTVHLNPLDGVLDVFRGDLTIEDSVFADNRIDGGRGLISFGTNDPQVVTRISRSVLARNTAAALVRVSYFPARVEVEQSTLVDNHVGVLFQGVYGENVTVDRSILNGNLSDTVHLSVSSSYTGADPELTDTSTGFMVPRPGSPVVDALACEAGTFDQRGFPTGVRAVYYGDRGTDCDYGAIEAQHHFCLARGQDTVACDEGEVKIAELAPGCRLIGGVLDCTGGQEVEITSLGPGESVFLATTELVMQTDGNLVLYENGTATWASGTDRCPCIGYSASFENGNLAVYSDPAAPGGAEVCYSTGTAGERAVLREGFRGGPPQFLIENADGTASWLATGHRLASGRSFALNGAVFQPGDALVIPGAEAVMQEDGNFVLYDTRNGEITPVWDTKTTGVCAGHSAVFQGDGNLVVGTPGTACLAAIHPPAGGTVLRLYRAPIGLASLALYNPRGEILWRAPQPASLSTRCADFPPGSPDGVYTVYDRAGAARQVYCDMSGGGWMLVGKVYLSHGGHSDLDEPTDWWTAGTGQVGALVPGTVDWTEGPDVASYGSAWLADLDLTVARFDLIAEDATFFERIADAVPGETATWYKDPSTLATWFSPADVVPTAVCASEALDCGITGRILGTFDATWLEGMRLDEGGGWLHLRPNVDHRFPFDGVCSYTFNAPGWPDDAAEHWGNGLDIWVK